MRTLVLLLIIIMSSFTSYASAQDTLVASNSPITESDLQKAMAASDFCEATRIEMKIARIDHAVYSSVIGECLSEVLDGNTQHLIVSGNLVELPNKNRRETLSQAIEVCNAYVERHERVRSLPYGHARYAAALEFADCVATELR